jgi:hypothetical protein
MIINLFLWKPCLFINPLYDYPSCKYHYRGITRATNVAPSFQRLFVDRGPLISHLDDVPASANRHFVPDGYWVSK